VVVKEKSPALLRIKYGHLAYRKSLYYAYLLSHSFCSAEEFTPIENYY
jgi:hypothetical protein